MEIKIPYRDWLGIDRTIIADTETPDKFVQMTAQDTGTIIDRNRILAEHVNPRASERLLARIPVQLYESLGMAKWGDDDWARFLNDPDYAYFRVSPERVV